MKCKYIRCSSHNEINGTNFYCKNPIESRKNGGGTGCWKGKLFFHRVTKSRRYVSRSGIQGLQKLIVITNLMLIFYFFITILKNN